MRKNSKREIEGRKTESDCSILSRQQQLNNPAEPGHLVNERAADLNTKAPLITTSVRDYLISLLQVPSGEITVKYLYTMCYTCHVCSVHVQLIYMLRYNRP